MAEDRKDDALAALDARIAAAKKAQEPDPRMDEHYSKAHQAWRMVIELVAGLGIGFGIGYGLDVLFGTMPVFLVLFVLFGFAAGVKTMIGTARELQLREEAAAEEDDRS
ncbi:MAG: AtpZ/AtpI family protein [Alphaproteobacteria bacterium]|nr:AtpZ/AtpI family protein [Alphaproteobacteria bacterium]